MRLRHLGGFIFVTIGLLKTLKNEAELAGVLAHEVAHVTQKHMLDTIQRGAVLSSATEFTLSAMQKDPQMYANVVDEITDKLFTKGLDKDLEYEADAYGIEFAYRAGYKPKGLRNYLKNLTGPKGPCFLCIFYYPSPHRRTNKQDQRCIKKNILMAQILRF